MPLGVDFRELTVGAGLVGSLFGPWELPSRATSASSLARSRNLTANDATSLEMALLEMAFRPASSLATFDRQLADAFRKLGGHVFGDEP